MGMGTYTAAQLLEKTRRLLGEQKDSTGEYPQSVWTDQFVLDGMNQGMDKLERYGFFFLHEQNTRLTTVAGQAAYELPSGVQEILSVSIGTPAPGEELAPVAPVDFQNLLAGDAYTLENDGRTTYLRISPTPQTTGTVITLKTLARQTQLSTYAAGTLTLDALPPVNRQFVVGTQTFTIKVLRSTTGEVTLGASIAETAANIVAAINLDLTTVTAEVEYSSATEAVIRITATTEGTSGNSIPFYDGNTGGTFLMQSGTFDGDGFLGGTNGLTITTNLPDRYNMFLVWEAVAYCRYREEESALRGDAKMEAQEIYDDLWRNELWAGGREIGRFKAPHEQLR